MHHAGLIICLVLVALALVIAAGYANTRPPPD
jgi:hypothetical protein